MSAQFSIYYENKFSDAVIRVSYITNRLTLYLHRMTVAWFETLVRKYAESELICIHSWRIRRDQFWHLARHHHIRHSWNPHCTLTISKYSFFSVCMRVCRSKYIRYKTHWPRQAGSRWHILNRILRRLACHWNESLMPSIPNSLWQYKTQEQHRSVNCIRRILR